MKPQDLFNNSALFGGQTEYQILSKAYSLLLDEEKWATRAFARDVDGRVVKPGDPSAVCWDIQGAVARSSNKWGILHPRFMFLLDSLAAEHSFESCNDLNDGVVHEDMLCVLVEAMRRTA